MSDTKINALRRSTGRDRDEWFATLDAWGAPGRDFAEIAAWLTSEHGVSKWWAQKLVVEYEQERGLRAPGSRPDGTFSATASKTVAVPVRRLFEGFISADLRDRWLPGVALADRALRTDRSARFEVDGGPVRLSADFATTPGGKSQVAVEVSHLPDSASAAEAKAFWRDRLTALKSLLETAD